jgi:hypothetical protein
LFNANSTIFQLYHGENKLIFNEMMMMTETIFVVERMEIAQPNTNAWEKPG